MKKQLKNLLLLCLMALSFTAHKVTAQTAGDFRTNGAVTFAALTNWQTYNGTAWVAATAAPTSADGVITIRNHIAQVTADVTLDQVVVEGTLQVNSGATLTLANGTGDDLFVKNKLYVQATGLITGAGQLVFGNQAVLRTARTGGVSASITSTSPTFTAGVSYEFNGGAAQSTGFTGLTMGNPLNLLFINPGIVVTIDRNLTITGTLTANNGAFVTIGAGVTSFTANAIYNGGTFNNCVNATISPAFTASAWANPKGTYTDGTATEPTTEASNIWVNANTTTAHLYWLANGNGKRRIVVLKAGSAVSPTAAIDNTNYTANAAFGTVGTELDGGFVVYNGSGSQVNVTGLVATTTYHVAVFEYNDNCPTITLRNYKTGSPLTTSFVAEERPFITEWVATSDGTLTIPTTGTGYNYNVSYRQILPTTGAITPIAGLQTGNCIISGLTDGSTYEVSITGTFPRIHFGSSTDVNAAKIRNIKQWGSIAWTSMLQAFGNSSPILGCNNLNSNATDVPNLSNVTDLQQMFVNCSIFNGGNVGNWNTQNVMIMSSMFYNAAFNQNISTWNTQNVTNMSSMFVAATSFNQNIGTWNTQNVTTMSSMFNNATAFNQNISTWNTQNVTTMSSMFNNATAFNQNISTWNTQNVTTMQQMFQNATAFNQNIGTWNTQNVTAMSSMFQGATAFNQNIGTWNTQNVTSMGNMFNGATVFNQNISTWNTQNVTTMVNMFFNANAFNQNIGTWNTQNVTNMSLMFNGATAFNQNIGTWNTGNVVNMSSMFNFASAFNQNIGTWNTQNVTNMGSMFNFAFAFNQNISTWNTQNVNNMGFMFFNATAFNQNLATWNVINVTTMSSMLNNCGMNTANYDATLISWAAQNVKTGVSLGATGRVYSCGAAATARQSLITGKTWAITGDVRDCISVSTTALSAFSACLGSASVAQSYTVSGTNLTADLVITPPSPNFEVSVTSATTGFAATQTLTQSGGNVSSTTVYIRQKFDAPNNASGTVTHISTGQATKNVSIPVSAVNALPTVIGVSAASVSTAATTFDLVYTGVTNAPNQYSITTGATAMLNFVAVTNATLGASPLTITIPASAANTYNFNLTVRNSTTGCVSAVVPFTLTVTGAPTPTISTSGTLTAFTTCVGTPSVAQNYTVSGVNLTADITVNAPAGFEVSKTSATTGFAATQTLTQAGGNVANTTIFVRLTGATAGTPTGNVDNLSTGATTQNVATTGTVTATSTPTVGITPVAAVAGTQLFTALAANIAGGTVTYDFQKNTVTQQNGATTTWNGTGLVATDVIRCVITVTGGTCLTATTATSNSVTVTGAATPTISTSGTLTAFTTCVGTPSVAQNYTVSGVNLTADITVNAPAGFEVSKTSATTGFAATQTLTQIGGNVANTTIFVRLTGATAGTPTGNVDNLSTGATTQNVATTGTVTATSTPTVGITPVAAVAGTQLFTAVAANIGGGTVTYDFQKNTVTQQNGATTTWNGTGLVATDVIRCVITVTSGTCLTATTATSNSVTVTGAATPTISTSGTLTAFTTCVGTPSVAQNYTVSGVNLTADITVNAPAGFEVSKTSATTNFAASQTLTQAGGNVANTTIFVRLTGASAGTPSGNVGNLSAGATTQNVAATGTVNATVTPTVSISPTSAVAGSQTFTATASNLGGGTVATYNFKIGASSQQSGALNTWNAIGLVNGNVVTCDINVTGGACLSTTTATSNSVTVTAAVTVPATALNFDGTDDHVVLANESTFDLATTLTIETRVFTPAVLPGAVQSIINKRNDSKANFGINFSNSFLYFYFNDGNYRLTSLSPSIIPLNQWVHFAYTLEQQGANVRAIAYINGVQVGTNLWVGVSLTNAQNNDPVRLGTVLGNDEFFQGNMDEVRIWNVVKTQSELLAKKDCELTGSEPNLLAYYNFNQGDGGAANPTVTALNDAAGTNDVGTLTNFTRTGATSNWITSTVLTACSIPAATATALNFDGTNDHVVLANESTFDLATTLTIETRVFTPAVLPGAVQSIINKRNDSKANFGINFSNSFLYFYFNDGNYRLTSLSPSIIPLNQWVHFAYTLEQQGANVQAIAYINGVQVGTNLWVGVSLTNAQNNEPVRLGTVLGNDEFFQGNMDEVRIWNVVKTQSELLAKKDCELIGTEPNLLAYYNFNQGDGGAANPTVTALNDAAGTNDVGTLTNFTRTGATSNWITSAVLTACSIPAATATALNFDGTNDHVVLANESTFDLATTLTIETRVFTPAVLPGAVQSIINKRRSPDHKTNFGINFSNSFLYFYFNDGNYRLTSLSPSIIPLNQWVHFAYTLEQQGADVRAIAYINGVQVGTNLWVGVSLTNAQNNDPVRLGTVLGNDEFFQGNMDEVRIWNVVKTQSELLAKKDCELTGSEPNLLAYYNFNQGDGGGANLGLISLNDAAGTNDVGTLTNFTRTGATSNWITSAVLTACSIPAATATALNFDGTDDHVVLANESTFDLATTLTIETRVFTPAVLPGAVQSIINKRRLDHNTNFGINFSNSVLYFYFNDGTYRLTSLSPSIIPLNQWVHFAYTLEQQGADVRAIAYINGVQVGTNLWVGVSLTNAQNNDPVRLGTVLTALGNDEFFQGNMDEVRIWNVVKTQSELLAKKDCELTGSEPNLLAYYNFNQGDGGNANPAVTALNDAAGTNDVGTLTNFTRTGATSNWITSTVLTGCPSPASIASKNNDETLPAVANFGSALQVYPNPTDNKITVELGLDNSTNVGIKLTDAIGRMVFNETVSANGLNFRHDIDMKDLASGVYMLLVNVEGKTTVKRIVKQ